MKCDEEIKYLLIFLGILLLLSSIITGDVEKFSENLETIGLILYSSGMLIYCLEKFLK